MRSLEKLHYQNLFNKRNQVKHLGSVLLCSMKLREKYKSLSTPEFVKQMMVASVYGSMQLEEQAVSRKKIELLYDKVTQEK